MIVSVFIKITFTTLENPVKKDTLVYYCDSNSCLEVDMISKSLRRQCPVNVVEFRITTGPKSIFLDRASFVSSINDLIFLIAKINILSKGTA